MRDQPIFMIFFILAFIILIDLYAYRGIAQVMQGMAVRQRQMLSAGFWLVTLIMVLWLFWLVFSFNKLDYQSFYRLATAFFGAFVLFYVPKLFFNVFLLVNDIVGFLQSVFSGPGPQTGSDDMKISRGDFLLRLGLVVSAIPFISIIWGIWKGKFNFRVERHTLRFPGLPGNFRGTRIIQISDFHIGSFYGNHDQVERAVEMINAEDADYILFTGDMVNNKSKEMEAFLPILSRITARKGKIAILGNHDYGDYYQWESEGEKIRNMEDLVKLYEKSGFTLLRNEAARISENGHEMAIIGVENWGLPPFPQYGDLEKAMKKVKDVPFKILLSHDPSHWDEEVVGKTDIALTLSGHTHGMQFAIRIPGWKWSPVSFKYRRWAGLYTEGKQKLYVNIGIGFIGFPGRVGTPPEITVFELI